MDETLLRVTATREAGSVRRCHIVPTLGGYNVAQHSFGAVSLLLLLHPAPSLQLIKAVQWHDVGERWLGDMPSPAKQANASLAEVYEDAEERVMFRLGLAQALTSAEADWLKAVDVLDLWLWTREEEWLGNRNVTRMRLACEEALQRLAVDGRLPWQAAGFYARAREQGHARLSDYFSEVAPGLPG